MVTSVAIYWCHYDQEWSVRFDDEDWSDQCAEQHQDPVVAIAGAAAVRLNQAGVIPEGVVIEGDGPVLDNVVQLFGGK